MGRKEHLPSTWSGAEIHHAFGLAEEVVLLVQLDELEGGTGAEALLLGHVIELIKTALSLLCFLWHVQKCNKLNRNIINISLSKQLKVR